MPPIEPRRKIIQALSPVLLEDMVRKLEAEGWQRVGDMALATPVAETKPPYWVQSMSHDPFAGDAPAARKPAP